MSARNTLATALLLVGGTLGAGGLRAPAPAAAAGGLPYTLDSHIPPSPYYVPAAVAARYCGHYALQPRDRRIRLDSGGIGIVRRSPGSLLGLMQIYSYDQQGQLTDSLAVLSNFHPLARDRMAIDLLDEGGQALGDSMLVTRTSRGDLVGGLTMDGTTYAIRWHRTAGC
jgi:hypothetical protein